MCIMLKLMLSLLRWKSGHEIGGVLLINKTWWELTVLDEFL